VCLPCVHRGTAAWQSSSSCRGRDDPVAVAPPRAPADAGALPPRAHAPLAEASGRRRSSTRPRATTTRPLGRGPACVDSLHTRMQWAMVWSRGRAEGGARIVRWVSIRLQCIVLLGSGTNTRRRQGSLADSFWTGELACVSAPWPTCRESTHRSETACLCKCALWCGSRLLAMSTLMANIRPHTPCQTGQHMVSKHLT
jgi:hypothetical protein